MILTRLNIKKVSSEFNQNNITDKLSYMRERKLQAFFKKYDFRKTINVCNEEFYNLMGLSSVPPSTVQSTQEATNVSFNQMYHIQRYEL